MKKLNELVSEFQKKKPLIVSLSVDFSDHENLQSLDKLLDFIKHNEFKTISFRASNLNQFPIENTKALNSLREIFYAISVKKMSLHVDLSSNNLGSAPALAQIAIPCLMANGATSVDLSNNNLSLLKEKLSHFFQIDKPNQALTQLDLSSNQLGQASQKDLFALSSNLSNYEMLTNLQLSFNQLGKDFELPNYQNKSFHALLSSLHRCPLERLDLTGNDLGELVDNLGPNSPMEEMKNIISLLTTHPSLKKLRLDGNSLFEWGAECLQEFFMKILTNPTLKELNLDHNYLAAIKNIEPEIDYLNFFIRVLKELRQKDIMVLYRNGNFNGEELDAIDKILPPPDKLSARTMFFEDKMQKIEFFLPQSINTTLLGIFGDPNMEAIIKSNPEKFQRILSEFKEHAQQLKLSQSLISK